jgi:hypothetical protein
MVPTQRPTQTDKCEVAPCKYPIWHLPAPRAPPRLKQARVQGAAGGAACCDR